MADETDTTAAQQFREIMAPILGRVPSTWADLDSKWRHIWTVAERAAREHFVGPAFDAQLVKAQAKRITELEERLARIRSARPQLHDQVEVQHTGNGPWLFSRVVEITKEGFVAADASGIRYWYSFTSAEWRWPQLPMSDVVTKLNADLEAARDGRDFARKQLADLRGKINRFSAALKDLQEVSDD